MQHTPQSKKSLPAHGGCIIGRHRNITVGSRLTLKLSAIRGSGTKCAKRKKQESNSNEPTLNGRFLNMHEVCTQFAVLWQRVWWGICAYTLQTVHSWGGTAICRSIASSCLKRSIDGTVQTTAVGGSRYGKLGPFSQSIRWQTIPRLIEPS